MTTAAYRDVHQIRPDLFLGSRPSDHRALNGRFDAVLDLRVDASDASPIELARLGIEYRHFPMTDGALPDGATTRLDELVAWIKSRLDQRRRVLVHCDAGASRSALVVGLYLVRTEHLGADQAIASMRSIRPVVQPHGIYVTFLRQASGEALPASAFAYLLTGEPPDVWHMASARLAAGANPALVRMAIERTIARGYWGLDTEFLDLDGGARRILLSVGLAGDDDSTYYAQIEEARPLLDKADDWVKAHVVPLLDCSSWRPRIQVATRYLPLLGPTTRCSSASPLRTIWRCCERLCGPNSQYLPGGRSMLNNWPRDCHISSTGLRFHNDGIMHSSMRSGTSSAGTHSWLRRRSTRRARERRTVAERRRRRLAEDSAADCLEPNHGECASESEHDPLTPDEIAEADQLLDQADVGLGPAEAPDASVPIGDWLTWLTPEQAAAYLQIAPSSLARLCHTGAVWYYTVWFSRTRRFRIETDALKIADV